MPNRFLSFMLVLGLGAVANFAPARAQDRSIVVASTTSTEDSGLFGYLLPIFKAWPVPTATTWTWMPVALVKAGSRWPNSPDSSVEVVEATVMKG